MTYPNICKYMCWTSQCSRNLENISLCEKDGDFCTKCEFCRLFDSNDARLCMEKLENKGRWVLFCLATKVKFLQTFNEEKLSQLVDTEEIPKFIIWLTEPSNFFRLLEDWLEKEGR